MKDCLDAAQRSDTFGARNILRLLGVDEDDETPEAHAAAFDIAKTIRLFNTKHTEKSRQKRPRR